MRRGNRTRLLLIRKQLYPEHPRSWRESMFARARASTFQLCFQMCDFICMSSIPFEKASTFASFAMPQEDMFEWLSNELAQERLALDARLQQSFSSPVWCLRFCGGPSTRRWESWPFNIVQPQLNEVNLGCAILVIFDKYQLSTFIAYILLHIYIYVFIIIYWYCGFPYLSSRN